MKPALTLSLLSLSALTAAAQTPCPQPHPTPHISGPLHRGTLLEHPIPIYPERAKSHHVSGTVLFLAHILADGTIGHLTILSGPPELQPAAEETVYRWRYTPWTAAGQPIDVYTSIPVNFGLNLPNGPTGPAPKPTGQPISALTLQGLLVRSFPAKRPKEAVQANIFGVVTLHVIVDATGRIADLGVLCGPEKLEDAALETVRHWIYQPFLLNGQPTAVDSTIDVPF